MLKIKNLTKAYGNKIAVNDISFSVEQGCILGLLGTNGAGKSTTMNIITGYLAATAGKVEIDGIDMLAEPVKAKSRIGYLPEKPPLYMDMTVDEYLEFVFRLKKIKLPKKQHLTEICTLTGIEQVRGRVLRNLSKGYCQRVGIAQALMGNPSLLILDEPMVGLDPKQIAEIRDLIKAIGANRTVILSSHILTEIQAICDRIVVISRGRIVADDSAEKLCAAADGHRQLIVSIEGEEKDVTDMLTAATGVAGVSVTARLPNNENRYELMVTAESDPRREIFFALAKNSWPLLECGYRAASLENIFLALTAQPTVETGIAENDEKELTDNDSNI